MFFFTFFRRAFKPPQKKKNSRKYHVIILWLQENDNFFHVICNSHKLSSQVIQINSFSFMTIIMKFFLHGYKSLKNKYIVLFLYSLPTLEIVHVHCSVRNINIILIKIYLVVFRFSCVSVIRGRCHFYNRQNTVDVYLSKMFGRMYI